MSPFIPRARVTGFSLVELMITLLIGGLVMAAASMMFVSNQRAYAATENLGRLQENGRVAFEVMARAMREAGGTPCGTNIPIVSTVVNASGEQFGWGTGIRGITGSTWPAALGTAPDNWVAGTDAIMLQGGSQTSVSVSKQPAGNAASLHINLTNHEFTPGDVLMVCDYKSAAIFMVTNTQQNNTVIVHNSGQGQAVGGWRNECKYLRFPRCATGPDAEPKNTFPAGSPVARFRSDVWYIGTNGRGGRSLFRQGRQGARDEIVEGVDDMELSYLRRGTSDYVRAVGAWTDANWTDVTAVRVDLTLVATEGALVANELRDVDGNVFSRQLSHTVTLRNRMP